MGIGHGSGGRQPASPPPGPRPHGPEQDAARRIPPPAFPPSGPRGRPPIGPGETPRELAAGGALQAPRATRAGPPGILRSPSVIYRRASLGAMERPNQGGPASTRFLSEYAKWDRASRQSGQGARSRPESPSTGSSMTSRFRKCLTRRGGRSRASSSMRGTAVRLTLCATGRRSCRPRWGQGIAGRLGRQADQRLPQDSGLRRRSRTREPSRRAASTHSTPVSGDRLVRCFHDCPQDSRRREIRLNQGRSRRTSSTKESSTAAGRRLKNWPSAAGVCTLFEVEQLWST